MDGKKIIRIHRVGTITLGLILTASGTLSLLRILLPELRYHMILRFWPVIFILLGVEVLLAARHKTYEVVGEKGELQEQEKMVYDFPAVLLLIVLLLFAMLLAGAELSYAYHMNFRL